MITKPGLAPGQRRHDTLVDLLAAQAAEHGDRRLYTFLAQGEDEEGGLGYGELDREARALGAWLQEKGVVGGRGLLLFPPGLEFIQAFFGCLYGGVTPVPAYPPRGRAGLPRLAALARDAGPSVVLTTPELLPRIRSWMAEIPELSGVEAATTTEARLAPESWRRPPVSAATMALLQYTSGSTSTPKGVMVSHGNLLHNESIIRRAFRQTEATVVASWLPVYHDMGLIGTVLQPLYSGGQAVLMSPVAFLQKPLRWLQAISRYRATTSGGPNFSYELCADRVTEEQRAELDLSCWEVAFNGAEPVRAATLERFARVFAPCGFRREAFFPCYGLAEATLFVSGFKEDASPLVRRVSAKALAENRFAEPSGDEPARELVGSGLHDPEEVRIAIVDPASGAPCGPGQVGEIWAAGRSVAGGYWGKPRESEETFRASLASPGGGEEPFLRTGDLGILDGGHLFITGRAKDLIIIRGRNHYPQDIELTVERSHPSLPSGGGAAFSVDEDGDERLVVVHEVGRRADLEIEAVAQTVRRAVSEEHELQLLELVVVRTGSIPKTSSGKIRRRECRRRYLEGELEVVARSRLDRAGSEAAAPSAATRDALRALPEDERLVVVAAALRDLAARALRVSSALLAAGQPLTAAGLDSLAGLELRLAVEERFGVPVSIAALLEGITLEGMAEEVVRGLDQEPAVPPAATARREEGPLGQGERALWFLHRMAPESAAYNLAAAVRIRAAYDPEALRRAFQALVERHPALRTAYELRGGEPRRRTAARAEVHFAVHDATGWSEGELRERLRCAADEPFDLERGPLFRVALFARAQEDPTLVVAAHHIVADFLSLGALARELGGFYRGEQAPPPPPLDYADYVSWEADLLAGPEGERLWSFWRRALAGGPPDLDLPVDRPRPPAQTFAGAALRIGLPAGLGARLTAAARSRGATLYIALVAAFEALLHRYTGQQDFAVGSPFAGRAAAGFDGVVGYFVQPLPLRADLSGTPSFAGLLDRVRQTVLGAFEHQAFPFATMAERLRPDRSTSRPPIFQVMVNFLREPAAGPPGLAAFALGEEGARLGLAGLPLECVDLGTRASQFDLTLTAAEAGGDLGALLQFSTDLFDGVTIARLGEHLAALLAGAAADPLRAVADLPLLSAAQRHQLSTEWNATLAESPRELPLHRLVEAQARRTPDAVALIAGEQHLSYGELIRRTHLLARRLRDAGAVSGVPVAVCLERSPELVVALLAVLASGAAYVPLDPAYPRERLAFMLTDTAAPVLIASESLAGSMPAARVVQVATAADRATAGGEEGLTGLGAELGGDALAYVIYTSGSTGRPKGVGITHRGAVNLVAWARSVFAAEELAGVLASTSVCFDLSVFELFVPLSHGGTVILALDALELPRLPAAERVTLVNTVPSAMAELVRMDGLPRSVTTVNLAGEALHRDLVDRIYAARAVRRVLDLYGPSEDTTYSTFALAGRGDPRPPAIGRPVDNTRVFLADRELRLVPPGAVGELCLGGENLARGYLGRPELTAERFVPDLHGPERGARLYRTGDLARYRPDGTLDYLGRIDHQVKIRGFRIELGEIESMLLRHPAVREAVVVARDLAGSPVLVAYVAGQGGPPAAVELREHLRQELPAHMVPGLFVTLDALPRTSTGKVDRSRLPAPAAEPSAAALRTPLEELLAGLWAELLGCGLPGPHDNFFDLGGHSLKAAQAAVRIGAALGVDLPLRALFDAPTVAALAAHIEGLQSQARVARPPLRRTAEGTEAPLSFAQHRLWLADQAQPGATAYNMAAAVSLEGELDLPLLAASLAEISRRHDVLRTAFRATGGTPRQVVFPPGPPSLPLIDLSGLPAERRAAVAGALAREEARRGFDLAHASLLRCRLVRWDGERHDLLLTAHHAVADGWSTGLYLQELASLYRAGAAGRPSPLPELPVRYADYAVWQRQHATASALAEPLAYWLRRLAALPVVELPADRPRPAVPSHRGEVRRRVCGGARTTGLQSFCRQMGATPFMVLLAVFQLLLARHTGSDDITVGTPVSQRDHRETEGLIGLFVNLLALRADLRGVESFAALLRQVLEATLEGHRHRDVPFEMLVERLATGRSLSHHPLVQVTFALEEPPAELRLPGLALRPRALDNGGAKLDLGLFAALSGEDLVLSLEYAVDLFEGATADRWLERLDNLLAGCIAEPARHPMDLTLLGAGERAQMIWAWNDTAEPEPAVCAHKLVEAEAARQPDAVAVVSGARCLTYGELNRQANRLAHLLRERGVGPETLVTVLLDRSPELLIAALAILKAGGAYLPLDPLQPRERLAFMIGDSRSPVLLTRRELVEGLGPLSGEVVCLDPEVRLPGGEEEDPRVPVAPSGLAYGIYTSGSTGRPKAVLLSHRGLANLVRWHHRLYSLDRQDRASLVAGVGFDASVWEIWAHLTAGAGLHVAPQEALAAPRQLAAWMVERGITQAFLPTPLAEAMLAEPLPPGLGLRALLTGGDRLHGAAAAGLPFVFVNHYGPTESTVVATAFPLRGGAEAPPPIGRPIANTRVYLLDRHLQPVPLGSAGELHIGGSGLARGYLNRPDLTAEKLIPDAFGPPGERLYRSGDLARFLPAGELEFLGRIDHQVKVRGFRIELGEIEAALRQHDGVREAVVVAARDRDTAGGGRLIAYLTPRAGLRPREPELRAFLGGKLPAYMVPSAFVLLDALPLMASGKVDRAALPVPAAAGDPLVEPVEPRSEVEALVAEIWCEVLRRERIGVFDDFFELGGHSLQIAQILSRVRDLFEVELSPRALFANPTVAGMTVAIAEALVEQVDEEVASEALADLGYLRSNLSDTL